MDNLQSARCSQDKFDHIARARKIKRSARMLANACKDYSIPLFFGNQATVELNEIVNEQLHEVFLILRKTLLFFRLGRKIRTKQVSNQEKELF